MSRFTVRMLVSAVLMSFIAVGAMGQTKVDDPFRFSIGVSAEFTDNRDSAPSGTKPTQKKYNVDYYIGPKFELISKPGESSKMVVSYNPVYRYRLKPSSIQNGSELFHNASLDYRNKSSEIQETRVMNFFNYTDDPAVTQSGTMLRRDSSYIYNKLEIGSNRKVQGVNSLDLSGYYSFKKYDEKAVALESDEDSYSLHALYLRQYQRKSAIAFDLELGGTGYKELANADRSFMTVIGAVGLEHIASPSLRMGARLGVQYVDYNDSDLGGATAPALNLSVIGTTIPTVAFTCSVDHRIRESDVFPYASQEATDLHGGMDWTLKEQNIVLSGGVTYHTGNYSQDALPTTSLTSSDGNEKSIVVNAGLEYKYNTETTVAVMFRSEDVSSDDGVTYGREFTRNSVTIQAAKQF